MSKTVIISASENKSRSNIEVIQYYGQYKLRNYTIYCDPGREYINYLNSDN